MDFSSRGGGARPLETTTWDGEPALLVPRWTTPPRLGRSLLGALALLAAAGAVWAGLSGSRGTALALGAAALVLLAVVVRDSLAMPYSGGLFLTPSRLAHRLGRDEWSMSWDDVADLVPDGDDLRVVGRDGREHMVRAHLLVTDLRTVGALADACRTQPARRASLGSEESRGFAEQARGALQPSGFRVAVQGALPSTRRGLFLASLVVAVVILAVAALGRSTSVDDDDLAQTLTQDVTLGGEALSEVACDGAIRATVGATQTCTAVVGGRQRTVEVVVASVDDDRIDYDVALGPAR